MPKIKRDFDISGEIEMEKIHQDVLAVIQEMRGEEVKDVSDTNLGIKVSTTLPSIWGWGGMKLGVLVNNKDGVMHMLLEGYIAQLATSPLKKVMGEFQNKLSSRLGEGSLTPSTNSSSNIDKSATAIETRGKDKKMVYLVIILVLVSTTSDFVFRTGIELLILTVFIGLAYFIGKKLFY